MPVKGEHLRCLGQVCHLTSALISPAAVEASLPSSSFRRAVPYPQEACCSGRAQPAPHVRRQLGCSLLLLQARCIVMRSTSPAGCCLVVTRQMASCWLPCDGPPFESRGSQAPAMVVDHMIVRNSCLWRRCLLCSLGTWELVKAESMAACRLKVDIQVAVLAGFFG